MVLGETLKAHARRKLRKAKSRMVDVTVMTLRAELAAQFTIRANATVRTLIFLVGDELDHPWNRVRLIVANKELPGSRTLYDLGVRTDLVCTVLLMPRLFTVYITSNFFSTYRLKTGCCAWNLRPQSTMSRQRSASAWTSLLTSSA